MKKIVLCVALFAIATTSFGQIFNYGVKGGFSLHSIDIPNVENVAGARHHSAITSNTVGFTVGAMGRISLPAAGIYFQPELMYSRVGYELVRIDGRTDNLNYQNFEMPILAGVNIAFLRVNAGPVINIVSFSGSEQNITRPDFGFQIGAGYTHGKFDFDVRYQGDLSRRIRDFKLPWAYDDIKVNGRFWLITMGYFFR